MKTYTLLAATLALGASVAVAAPMKELDVYQGGLGKFVCDAKEIDSGKGFKAVVEKTVEFDGSTYVERYYEAVSPDHPNPWKGIFVMSYDPASKRWVRNGVDNSGERNAATSSGWKGDTWVWEMDGANIVITNKGRDAYAFAVDVKQSNGVKRVVEAMCARM